MSTKAGQLQSLECVIADLPLFFADEALLRSIWKHLHMLDGQESHEAIEQVCRLAAEIEGIELGHPSTYAESQVEGVLL